MQQVAKKLNVDEIIKAEVIDDDQTSYTIEVVFARRPAIKKEQTAGFFVVLEWLKGQVAIALQKPATVTSDKPSSDESSPAVKPDGTETTPQKDTDTLLEPDKADDGKLSPAPFYVAAAVTGALFVGWGITDLVVHKKFTDLKEGKVDADNWTSRRDSLSSLQTVDRVLLGATIVGVLTTGVLFFMTDFDTKKDAGKATDKVAAKFIPTVAPNGGMLILKGSF